MGQFCIKPTGSKTTGKSSGTWTDSDCYPSLGAINDTDIDAGDTVEFDNTVHDYTTRTTLNSMTGAGHFIFKSRGNNGATLRNTADAAFVICNNSSAAQTYDWQDLTMASATPYTFSGSQPVFQTSQLATSATFTRVKFDDYTLRSVTNTTAIGLLIDFAAADGGFLYINDCEFINSESTTATGQLAAHVVNRKGPLRINGLTVTDSTLHNAECFARPNVTAAAYVHKYENIDLSGLTITGDQQFEGFVFHSPGASGGLGKFYNNRAYNISVAESAGSTPAHRGLFAVEGAEFDMAKIIGTRITYTEQSGSTGGIGGLVVVAQANAFGTVRDIRGEEIIQAFGSLIYASASAQLNLIEANAYGCEQRNGTIYLGGWDGHMSVKHARIYESRQATSATSLEGIGLYLHQREESSVGRTSTLRDVDIQRAVPLTAGTSSAMFIRNQATTTHTNNVIGCTLRNSDLAAEIKYQKSSSGNMTATVTNNNIRGGAGSVVDDGLAAVSVSGTTDTSVSYDRGKAPRTGRRIVRKRTVI